MDEGCYRVKDRKIYRIGLVSAVAWVNIDPCGHVSPVDRCVSKTTTLPPGYSFAGVPSSVFLFEL